MTIAPSGPRYRPPRSWYLVCRAGELRRGGILSRDVLGRSVVIYRGQSGQVYALAAHCAHMGAHLGLGEVTGDRIRCPLHRWEYDGEGICRHAPLRTAIPEGARQAAFPTAERYGAVFLFNGRAPTFPPPSFAGREADWTTRVGSPVRLRCAWPAIGANVFDMEHLEAAHERVLCEPPVVTRPDRYRLQLRYATQITGRTLTDRVTRGLSGNRIRASITCWGGTVVTAENDIGRARSALLLGVLPTTGGVEVTPLFGVPSTGFGPKDRLRVGLARWLISGFLRRDVCIMDGMRLHHSWPRPGDGPLSQFLAFLEDLKDPDPPSWKEDVEAAASDQPGPRDMDAGAGWLPGPPRAGGAGAP
jgi:nitrite reductase/ring-hydroxylating ferredoxin subunit